MPTFTAKPPGRRSGPPRVAALIAGGLAGFIAFAFLVSGAAVLWADSKKDDRGYLNTSSERFATGTRALATEDLDIDAGGSDWFVDRDLYGKVRLEVKPHADKDVFVGIARSSDVAGYLRQTDHTVVTDVSYDPFDADYRDHAGGRPAPPAEQDFWATSTHGAGPQSLTWDVESGSWSIVVMNADGSPGVDAGVSAGADVPVLPVIGWSLLGTGTVLLAVGGGLTYAGVRRPRVRPRQEAPAVAV